MFGRWEDISASFFQEGGREVGLLGPEGETRFFVNSFVKESICLSECGICPSLLARWDGCDGWWFCLAWDFFFIIDRELDGRLICGRFHRLR